MRRLVYAPKAHIFVRIDNGSIIDLSDYVVSGSVQRVLNAPSHAEFEIRNPNQMFTKPPLFRPMDTVTIFLTRLRNRPIQVFSGYIDEAPYQTLFPQTVNLTATCSLKRLNLTYFDPGLPYTQDWLWRHGWMPSSDGTVRNIAETAFGVGSPDDENEQNRNQDRANAGDTEQTDPKVALKGTTKAAGFFERQFEELDTRRERVAGTIRTPPKNPVLQEDLAQRRIRDGNLGILLKLVIQDIGGWDEQSVLIEELPKGIEERIVEMALRFNTDHEKTRKAAAEFLKKLIGVADLSSGGGTTETADEGTNDSGNLKPGEWTTIKASYFNGSNGACGSNDSNNGNTFAELSKNPSALDFSALGGLKCKAFLKIRYKSKEVVAQKMDKGAGGSHGARIDLYNSLRQHLGAPAGIVEVDVMPCDRNGNPIGKDGKATSNDGDEKLVTPGTKSLDNGYANNDTIVKMASKAGRDEKAKPASGGADDVHPVILPKDVVTDTNGYTGAGSSGHSGIDIITDGAKTAYACVRGKIIAASNCCWWSLGVTGDASKGDGIVKLQATEDVGSVKKGMVFGYGHAENVKVKEGDLVDPGTPLCTSGYANAWHIHFFACPSNCPDGQIDVTPFYKAFQKGKAPTGGEVSAGPGSTSGGATNLDPADVQALGNAAAFAAQVSLPSILDSTESILLTGAKSLMNDEPLMPFVEQICQASLRTFQSTPDGRFFAFYPDYFGSLGHRAPYWEINDIEILHGKIDLTDEALATHVYVVGDTLPHSQDQPVPDVMNKWLSGGVVSVFEAFRSGFMLYKGDTQPDKELERIARLKGDEKVKAEEKWQLRGQEEALKFLQRYGARPHVESMPMIRSPYYEAFMAYQTFQLLWSKQFLTTFTFTFMPELYPGGRVVLPDHGIQLFIDAVRHEWNYESGFTTQANLSAPSVHKSSAGNIPGGANIPYGMIMPTPLDEPL